MWSASRPRHHNFFIRIRLNFHQICKNLAVFAGVRDEIFLFFRNAHLNFQGLRIFWLFTVIYTRFSEAFGSVF